MISFISLSNVENYSTYKKYFDIDFHWEFQTNN